MTLTSVRKFALALPETTEQPHHHHGSFRVRGRIYATFPPEGDRLHLFPSETDREQALAMHPEFAQKLLWGGKVAGLRIDLSTARPAVVKLLLQQAWRHKAATPSKRARAAGRSGAD